MGGWYFCKTYQYGYSHKTNIKNKNKMTKINYFEQYDVYCFDIRYKEKIHDKVNDYHRRFYIDKNHVSGIFQMIGMYKKTKSYEIVHMSCILNKHVDRDSLISTLEQYAKTKINLL